MRTLEYMSIDLHAGAMDCITKMETAHTKFLMVLDNDRLVGTVTDGDIRRWVLRGGGTHEDVSTFMHPNPTVLFVGEEYKAKELMIGKHLSAIPIVNREYVVQDVIFDRDLVVSNIVEYRQIDVPVVIMAGGKGTRLLPYTNVLPKPLIPINGKPIIDRIIASFRKNGCRDFYLTLNYKKNLISAYMSEREDDCHVCFAEEESFYGTCGSISLLKGKISETFFVTNCDVLLDVDYSELLEYHQRNVNAITMVVALKNAQLPYGVVELDADGSVKGITEKPSFAHHVNTGIYIMEPSLIDEIPKGKVYHMTDLLEKIMQKGRRVGAYVVPAEKWDDMGEIDAMHLMMTKYA